MIRYLRQLELNDFSLKDLITYFPREYEDRSKPKNIEDLVDGEEALISCYPIRKNEYN